MRLFRMLLPRMLTELKTADGNPQHLVVFRRGALQGQYIVGDSSKIKADAQRSTIAIWSACPPDVLLSN
jgi:hypothetical protein